MEQERRYKIYLLSLDSVLVAEVEYVFHLGKPIIPVLCDHYVPDGWLGILIAGVKLHKATSDEDLMQGFPEILAAIEQGKFFSRVSLIA